MMASNSKSQCKKPSPPASTTSMTSPFSFLMPHQKRPSSRWCLSSSETLAALLLHEETCFCANHAIVVSRPYFHGKETQKACRQTRLSTLHARRRTAGLSGGQYYIYIDILYSLNTSELQTSKILRMQE